MNPNSPDSDAPEEPVCNENTSTSPVGDLAVVSSPEHITRSVMCAGMFSSGSTWVFNIVAQLLRKAHPGFRIAQTYADEFASEHETQSSGEDCLVFKTHAPSPATRMLARLGGVPLVLSIRDPRDAIASLMQRFSVSFDWAFEKVVASSESLIGLRDLPHLLLRYEDGFTNRDESVAKITQHLGLCLPPEALQSIFAAFTPDAVKAKIADLQAFNIISGAEPANMFDPQTQWHPGHVGDLQIGKWKNYLTPAQAARVSYATRNFSAAFSYRDPDVRFSAGAPVSFSTEGTGVEYLASGFSDQEKWGIWTACNYAMIRLKLDEPINDSVTIEILFQLAPTLRRSATNTTARISANGARPVVIAADDQNPDHLLLCINLNSSQIKEDKIIEIHINFDNLRSSAEIGASSDLRLIGLGLLRLRMSI